MRDFVFLVTDDRYSVPTLQIVPAADEEQARGLARRILEESPHHTAVDVRSLDAPLFAMKRDTARTSHSQDAVNDATAA